VHVPMGTIALRQLRTDPISAAGIPLEREMTPSNLRSPVNPPQKAAALCDKENEPASVRMCLSSKCPHSNPHKSGNAQALPKLVYTHVPKLVNFC
jgi:hypothetical protein